MTHQEFTCQGFKKQNRYTFNAENVTQKEYGKFQQSFIIVEP